MNPHYAKRAQALVDFAMSLSDAAQELGHAGVRGRAREVFAKDLLTPFLSPNVATCSGLVVDSEGGHSRQVDVIVYDRALIPTLLFTGEEGVVPIESVLATIEVKSALSRQELRDAIENAHSVKRLRPKYMEVMGEVPEKSSPICCTFAFRSDCAAERELARLNEIVREVNETADHKVYVPLSGLCVGDRSFTACTGIEYQDVPIPTFSTHTSSAAVRFLVFLIDQISILERQRSKMLLFHYFLEKDDA
jgi:hypothetical protein